MVSLSVHLCYIYKIIQLSHLGPLHTLLFTPSEFTVLVFWNCLINETVQASVYSFYESVGQCLPVLLSPFRPANLPSSSVILLGSLFSRSTSLEISSRRSSIWSCWVLCSTGLWVVYKDIIKVFNFIPCILSWQIYNFIYKWIYKNIWIKLSTYGIFFSDLLWQNKYLELLDWGTLTLCSRTNR